MAKKKPTKAELEIIIEALEKKRSKAKADLEDLVLPYLNNLENTGLDVDQKIYISLAINFLKKILDKM